MSNQSFYLQGERPRDPVTLKECFWPANGAQYFHAISLSTESNKELNAIRERNLKQQGLVAFYGYESILPDPSSSLKRPVSELYSPSSSTNPSFLSAPPTMIGREVVVRVSVYPISFVCNVVDCRLPKN